MHTQLPHVKSPHPKSWHQIANQAAIIEINFYLHPHANHQEKLASMPSFLEEHPANRTYETSTFPADETALTGMRAFAKIYHVKVVKADLDARLVVLSGSIAAFSHAFNVHLAVYLDESGAPHLSYEGHLVIPSVIAPYIVHIGGLDHGLKKANRSKLGAGVANDDEQMDRSALPEEDMVAGASPNKEQFDQSKPPVQAAATAIKGFTPQDIEKAYNFPAGDAAGECIGLIELGGHYMKSDIDAYCQLHQVTVPEIVIVGKEPKVPESAQMIDNLEVSMDIQLAAGLAPNAKIVIYYAATIEEGMHLAVNDLENNPSVLSISWALSEQDMSKSEGDSLYHLLVQAAQKGITVIAASGDYGAYNKKKNLNIMSPASSPLVLACGGTALYHHDNEHQEVTWESHQNPKQFNGSGGGFSNLYIAPDYQKKAIANYKYKFPNQQTGRSIPDISANSAAETAYNIVINGQQGAWGGGTSASTPVWAALIARINSQLGYRVGFVNPLLYKMISTPAFNQVVYGSNGYYPAAYGWDAATGLGTPNGQAILDAIKATEPKTAQ